MDDSATDRDEMAPVEAPVDVETIMEEIRAQILARKGIRPERAAARTGPRRRFSPDLYEHLYRAEMLHDQLDLRLQVTPTRLPLIGPLVQWARGQIHALVIFYVNQLAARQMEVNTHLLQAIDLLASELESLPPAETLARLAAPDEAGPAS